MDNLTAKKLDADARIASAQAQVTSAEVNMSFTTIRAPISGRIGRSLVSPGDLVSSSTGDLTTLVSIDPIEALFQVSEATYISNLESRMDNERDLEAVRNIEVTLELINGVGYPEVGQYVRVTLQDTNLLEGLFVPQAAIQGVEEGEQVIVRGLQQVRPGMVVTTTSIAGAGAEEKEKERERDNPCSARSL